MPDEYKHPRHGLKSVRTELNTVLSKLLSELYISKHQIEGAIAIITNMLFGWELESYNTHQTPDLDTLPKMRNILQIKHLFEAMTLNAIVGEIMKAVTTACTVYANDGSSRSGLGYYIVQSLTIISEQPTFSMFDIFAELRESLAKLEATTPCYLQHLFIDTLRRPYSTELIL